MTMKTPATEPTKTDQTDQPGARGTAETLTITDNRTGRQYDIAIKEGAIRATDLRQIKADAEDGGLMTYDPAFLNTAACRSAITYIDGDKGILWYRGYPIEQLAEHCKYLEVAYLILFGELPTEAQLTKWTDAITQHTLLHENVKKLMEGFQYDAHPMGIFISTVGALSTLYRDAKQVFDQESRNRQCTRLIAKVASIAGYSYRHSIGRNYIYPDNDLSFTGNFLNMLFKMTELKYRPNPVLERALDVLFILHADHEQNCSTTVMRNIGSSHVDPYSAIAGAAGALWGPLHGGANEAVLRMLEAIGSKQNVPAFIKRVKAGDGRLMGFGHRVYKSYDPRAKIIKRVADDVFEVTGKNPLLDIALELERIALDDEYFITRKLYPNVDFYSGLIYQAMGFPKDFFPVMFAIPRTAGWFAHWEEMLLDPEQKIARPRQIYIGPTQRDFVARDKR
jgi:citrate synthase